jgi:3-oxoacyl-[acyl-carrier protein] reductase
MELTNATILIVGGQRVGQTVATELGQAGAQIAMTYLKDPAEVAATVDQVPQARSYRVDVTEEQSLQDLLTAINHDFGQVDALINMASIFAPDPAQLTGVEIQKRLAVMVGNMLLCRRVAEQARERHAKLVPIVSFIDWAVDHPYANYDVYLAGKAMLRHYLMALQTTFAGTIRVVNIHPGMILEPPDFPADEKAEIMKNTPTHSIGDPEQAARLVHTALENDFLVDNIYLDGGQHWRHRL